VATQPSDMVFIERSLPIEGSAIFIADPMKGVRKELIVVTKSIDLLRSILFFLQMYLF
jgi:hypothetical protein